jgi:hypothetical protein
MAVGLPLELVTMLGSGLMSGVMTLWSQSLKAKAEQHSRLMEKVGVHNAAVESARKYNAPGFQFTRRLIALSAVFSIIVLPKLAAVLMPELPVLVGYTEWNPGFWFFTEGVDQVKWMAFEGLVITPLDTHLMSAIIGLYFGASVVKNS